MYSTNAGSAYPPAPSDPYGAPPPPPPAPLSTLVPPTNNPASGFVALPPKFDPTQNAISRLQNVARKMNIVAPQYEVIRLGGKDHSPIFQGRVSWDNNALSEIVQAGSKSEARRRAAYNMLERLKLMGIDVNFDTRVKAKHQPRFELFQHPVQKPQSYYIGRAGSQEAPQPQLQMPYVNGNGNNQALPNSHSTIPLHSVYKPPMKAENFGFNDRAPPQPHPTPHSNMYGPPRSNHANNSGPASHHGPNSRAHGELQYRNRLNRTYYRQEPGAKSDLRSHRPRDRGGGSNHRSFDRTLGYSNSRYPNSNGGSAGHRSSGGGNGYQNGNRNGPFQPASLRQPPTNERMTPSDNYTPVPQRPSFSMGMGVSKSQGLPGEAGNLPPILRRGSNSKVTDPRLKLRRKKAFGGIEPMVKEELREEVSRLKMYEQVVKGVGKIDDSAERAVKEKQALEEAMKKKKILPTVSKEPAQQPETVKENEKPSKDEQSISGKGTSTNCGPKRKELSKNSEKQTDADSEGCDNERCEPKSPDEVGALDVSIEKRLNVKEIVNTTRKKNDSPAEETRKVKSTDETPEQLKVSYKEKNRSRSPGKKTIDSDAQANEREKKVSDSSSMEIVVKTTDINLQTQNHANRTEKSVTGNDTIPGNEVENTANFIPRKAQNVVQVEMGKKLDTKDIPPIENSAAKETPDAKVDAVSLPAPPPRKTSRRTPKPSSPVETESPAAKKRTKATESKAPLGRYIPRRRTRSMTRSMAAAKEKENTETPPKNKDTAEPSSPRKRARKARSEIKPELIMKKKVDDSAPSDAVEELMKLPESGERSEVSVGKAPINDSKKLVGPVVATPTARKLQLTTAGIANSAAGNQLEVKETKLTTEPTTQSGFNDSNAIGMEFSIDTETRSVQMNGSPKKQTEFRTSGKETKSSLPNSTEMTTIMVSSEAAEIPQRSQSIANDSGVTKPKLGNEAIAVTKRASAKPRVRSSKWTVTRLEGFNVERNNNSSKEGEGRGGNGMTSKDKRSNSEVSQNDESSETGSRLTMMKVDGVSVRGARTSNTMGSSSPGRPRLLFPAKKRARTEVQHPEVSKFNADSLVVWVFCDAAEESVYDLMRLVAFAVPPHVNLSIYFYGRTNESRPSPLIRSGDRLRVFHEWDHAESALSVMFSMSADATIQSTKLKELRSEMASDPSKAYGVDFSLSKVAIVTAQRGLKTPAGIELVSPKDVDVFVEELESSFKAKHGVTQDN